MKSKRISFNDLSQYMVVISIVLVFGIFAVLNPNFLSPYSLQNLLTEISPLVLLAGGLSFIIFTGGIDLGAGAMVSATCVISGLYVSRFGNGILPVMLVIGFFLGLLNGVIVTKLKIPSFIVTLCTQNLWAFIALYFCPNGSVAVGMDFRKEIAWMTDKVFGIPIIFIVAIAAVIVLYIFQQYTSSGRSIFAVGAKHPGRQTGGSQYGQGADYGIRCQRSLQFPGGRSLRLQAEIGSSHHRRRADPFRHCVYCPWRHFHGRRPGKRSADFRWRCDHYSYYIRSEYDGC